jgi:Histidine phosphatase superfamily (branch 1)
MANAFPVTTVILVRHGERNAPTPASPDPHLNTAGKVRAKKLIHVVGQSGIKAIYRSHFVRARETAQPLATYLGLSPIEIDGALPIKNHILSNHTGKRYWLSVIAILFLILSGDSVQEVFPSLTLPNSTICL